MKKITFLKSIILAVIFLMGSVNLSAQLLVEDFNYTIGTVLTATATADPTTNWLAHSGNGSANVDVTNGLSFTGYAGSGIGGAANLDANGQDINKVFTPQSSGVVFTVFMLQTESSNNAGYFFMLSPAPVSTSFYSRIFVNSTGDGIGLSASSTPPSSFISITPLTPVLVVIKHDFTLNTTDLYVLNSYSSSEPASASQSISETYSNPVGGIALRQYNSSQRQIIDGIRIGTTWAEAVAPSSSSCTASDLAFANATVEKTMGDAAFTIAATSENATTAITYASENTAVATVNASTGEVTLVDAGQAVITATQAAGTHNAVDYCSSTASYTLNVASTTPTISVTETVPDMVALVGANDTKIINVSGENLTEAIALTISGTDASLFELSINSVTQTGGTAASTEVTVKFTPVAPGTSTATLTLSSAGAADIVRTLTGIGIDPANPYTLDNSSPVSELNEGFEAPTAIGFDMPTNWKNVNAVGTKSWEVKLYSANQYAQMSAFSSTGVQQTLLISPAIDFDQIVKNNVTFGLIAGYAKVGTTLKVYVMTLDGTKTEVKSINRDIPTSGYDATFATETLDLTAFSGIKFLVFEYNGDGTTGLTTTYQIDNIVVQKNPSTGFSVSKEQLEVFADNGNIKFSAIAGESVQVYNAIGQKLVNKIAVEGMNTIPVAAHGVVLVKVGTKISKVIL